MRFHNAFSLCLHTVSIYRCATATLPLRNSKVTVGQQQPYRCAAVNNIVMSEQGKRIIKHEKKNRGKLSDEMNRKRGSEQNRAKEKNNPSEMRERKIAEDTDYSVFDNTLYAWWFKRNDNHEQSGCQEDFDITQYDAYYTVPVSEKKMYITFDCGYENGFTPDMLDVLKEEQVTAAFFVTQTFIRDNVDLVKRMKEEGHLVCNHTVTHPSMPGKSVEEQRKELLD